MGETEKKLNIPHSTNRFQGKYQEIVPLQYKARKGMLEKEKREQEAKKEIIKQRVLKAKTESEKIREANMMMHTQKLKCLDLPLQMKSPKKKNRKALMKARKLPKMAARLPAMLERLLRKGRVGRQ